MKKKYIEPSTEAVLLENEALLAPGSFTPSEEETDDPW